MTMVKITIPMILLVLLFSCKKNEIALHVKKNGNEYSVDNGRFKFTVPDGWKENRHPDIKASGFICGFHEDTMLNKFPSYFLVQLSEMTISNEDKKSIIDTAYPLEKISGLASYIEEGKHEKQRELWNSENDVAISIQEYHDGGPSLSIMVKKFDGKGTFIIHYYCLNQLSDDVTTIERIAKSINSGNKRYKL